MKSVILALSGLLIFSTSAMAFPCDDYKKDGLLEVSSVKELGDIVLRRALDQAGLKHGIAYSGSTAYPSQKYYYGLRTLLPTLFHAYGYTIGERSRFYSAVVTLPNTAQTARLECAVNRDYGYVGWCAHTNFYGCVIESEDAALNKAVLGISVQSITH